MSSAQVPPPSGKMPDYVRFHWIKSNFFRVIHADGVWGGITPTGNVQMAIFSQRTPIPQQTAQKLYSGGNLGEDLPELKVCKDGIVREVEIEVIMDLNLAVSIRAWLDEKIKVLESGKGGQQP
jgi:hypothetical protein